MLNFRTPTKAVLLMLLASGPLTMQAQTIPATLGVSSAVPEDFFGYNGANFVRANEPNYNTQWIVDSLSTLNASTVRYTAGIVGNYWNWQKGWFVDDLPEGWILPKDFAGVNPKKSDLNTFKAMVNRAGVRPMLSCNVLTSNKEFQLAELFYGNGINIPIKYIEMGSELYHSKTNYIEKFPTAESYALYCNDWANYFKSFPFFASNKIGVVGATERPEVPYSRRNSWTEKVAATVNNNIDAIILHYYNAGGWLDNPVTVSNVYMMLSTPFKQLADEKKQLDLIRNAGKEAWLTEYNHFDRQHCTHDTWAHGLFTASQTLSFFEDSNIKKILCHALTSDARMAALFNDTSGLIDYDSYKGGLSCNANAPATRLHERSAAGTSLQQVAHAMYNAKTKKQIDFGAGTPLFPNGYKVLYGWQFDGPTYTEAIILNLDSISHNVSFDTTQWNLKNGRYEQIYSGPNGPLEYIVGNPKYNPDSNELGIIPERLTGQTMFLKPWSLTRVWVAKNTVYIKPTDSTICNGTFTTMQAFGGKKYTWSGAKFEYLTADSSLVKFTNGNNINKVYTVTVTNEKGTTATANITVYEMPTLTVSSNATTVCAGTEVKLTANISTSNPNAQFSFVWVPSQEVKSPNASITKVYPTKTTTFTVYATDGKCFAPADSVIVFVEPVAEAGQDKMIELGVPYQLKPTIMSANATYSWYENNVLIGTDSVNVTPAVVTTYMLIATNIAGTCSDTDYVTLTPFTMCHSAIDTLLTIPPYTTTKQFAQRMIAYCAQSGIGIATDTTLKNFSQDIIFNGPLIVNDDFVFTNCPGLKFGEGAYFYHKADNRILEFYTCTLSAANCNNKMWRGLLIEDPSERITMRNTIINDAIIGIESLNNSEVFAYDCTFNNCYIGLKYEHFDESEVVAKIQGCSFFGSKCNLEPYVNATRLAGIICDNAASLEIGNKASAPNVFSDSYYGIHAINTSLTLKNNIFTNLIYDTLSGFTNTGTAVFLSNSNGMGNPNVYSQLWPILILNVGDTTPNSSNTFSNLQIGIQVENAEVTASGNVFNNMSTAISISGSVLKNLNITDNTIGMTDFGIYLNDNKFAATNVLRNNITTSVSAFNTSLKYGIRVIESAGMSSYLKVSENTINLKGLQGIWVSNNHQAQIDNNNITIDHNKQLSANGIRIENSDSVAVTCNRVQGTNTSNFYLDQKAISMTFCPSAIVQCNTTDLTGTGLEFLADCNLANIKNNVLKAHNDGLVIGEDLLTGGVIGPQPAIVSIKPTGNVFQGHYTITSGPGLGKGFFQHAATLAVNSQASGPIGSANQFIVFAKDSLQIPYLNLNSGTNATSITPTIKSINPSTCPVLCILPVGKQSGVENENISTEDQLYIKDRVAAELYANTNDNVISYSQKLQLLKSIQPMDLVSTNADALKAFYSKSQLSNTDKLKNVYNDYLSLSSLNTQPNFNSATVVSDALNVAKSFEAKNEFETNMQILEVIKLKNLSNKTSYSQSDLNTIKAIAMKCPYTAGTAVFDARGICAMYFNLYFDDLDLCSGKFAAQTITSKSDDVYFMVYPNPAKENISMSFNLNGYKNAQFELYDIAGRKVIHEPINTISSFKSFDLIKLEEGIYSYVVIADGQKVKQGKLCIIK